MPKISDADFKNYVSNFRKQGSDAQTHTWFPPGKTMTLHVPTESVDEFMEHLFDYVYANKASSKLETPARGLNSFTEKITPDRFRLFVDIDFGIKDIEKGYLPSDKNQLQNMVRTWVEVYDQMIEELFGLDYKNDRIVAIRLLYKIHLIYPSVIVNSSTALALREEFMKRLQQADESFENILTNCVNCIDPSVYKTGLRMLYMHKGNMGQKKKESDMMAQIDLHEQIFGEDTYKNIYRTIDLTDFETEDFSLETFKKFSIHVLDDSPLTGFVDSEVKDSFIKAYAGTLKTGKSRKGKGPAKGSPIVTADSEGDYASSLPKTLEFLKHTYCRTFKNRDIEKKGDVFLIILGHSTECPIKGETHQSNRQYLKVTGRGSAQMCYDDLCRDQEWKFVAYDEFPSKMKLELKNFGIGSAQMTDLIAAGSADQKEDMQKKAVQSFFGSIRSQFPKTDLRATKYNFSEAISSVYLPNHYCEVCKVSHDTPSTWFRFTQSGQGFFECAQNFGIQFPNPPIAVDHSLRSLIFCNITFNLNLCESTADIPVDFDREAEPIFPEDEDLNLLMFEALNGNHINIAAVIHYLGKEKFAFTRGKIWYYYENHRWHPNRETALKDFIKTTVLEKFRLVRAYYEDNTIDQTLRSRRVAHINTKIIEKISNTRPMTDIITACQTDFLEHDFYKSGEKYFEDQLDEKTGLLCFSNGILDLDTPDLQFRPGHPKDFVTLCVNYDFPTPNPEKRAKVEQFFWDIMPEAAERNYLLLYLASLLHGRRPEEFFHIFTGGAGNGKSLLRDLIMFLFGDYFENVPSNLFTRERPGTSSPQPEIVRLKGKRVVFASEPEQNQKINTGFIKFITGGDPIKARNLNSNNIIEFKPHFAVNLLANEIPPLDKSDGGTDRRLRVLAFLVKFCDNPKAGDKFQKQIDVMLKDTIIDCRDDLLLMLLEYFKVYRDVNEFRLRPTPKMRFQTHMHKLKSNPVQHFMETMTVQDESAAMFTTDLHNKFVKWCKIQRTDSTLGKKPFEDELKRLEYNLETVRIGSSRRLGIVGRSWKDQEIEEANESQRDFRNGIPDDEPVIMQLG